MPLTTCHSAQGAALPLTLLAIGLAQATLLLGWQYLGAEMALLHTEQADVRRHRLVLACALQPGIAWAGLAGGGERRLPVRGDDERLNLSRRVWRQADLPNGGRRYWVQCGGGVAGAADYRVRSGWLLEPSGRYRLISVLPDAP